ncbi:MAG: hypothetical protein ACP5C3_01100 [Methanomicrobiales archaeon]
MSFVLLIGYILMFLVAILIVYYSILLYKGLENEDISLSMIFLNEKRILIIFKVLVVASIIFLLGGFSLVIYGETTLMVRLASIIYSVGLLYFVYSLQKIIRMGVVK